MAFPATRERLGQYQRREGAVATLATLREPLVALAWGIVGLALLVRLLGLGTGSLSYDEAGYALDAWRLFTGTAEPGAYFKVAPGYSPLLGLTIYVLGGSEIAVRSSSVLLSAGAVLFCFPLARLLGRPGAYAAAFLLALSPFWIDLGSHSTPDMAAVAVALLGVSLTVSRHKWRASLVAASAAAGYCLALGVTGIWLGGFLAVLIAITCLRHVSTSRALACLLVFLLTAAAGYTAFFTRLPTFGAPATGTDPYLGPTQILREVLLSAPALASLVALPLLALKWPGSRRTSELRMCGLVALLSVLVLAVVFLLASQLVPTPAVLVLILSLTAGWLLGRASAGTSWRRMGLALAVAGFATLVAVVIPGDNPSAATVPSGVRLVRPAGTEIKAAFKRVRRVSAELYVLERSKIEPRGGRALRVELAPAVSNWGLWYLRDFPNVWVWPQEGQIPEVQVLAGSQPAPSRGARQEHFGEGISFAWSAETWAQISPNAGTNVPAPKAQYNLFDAAPPGDKPGQFDGPVGISIAPDGTVYVVDQNNSRVQKFAADGRFLLQWGSEGSEDGQFGEAGPSLGPTGIASTNEYVWIADTWNHRIQQFRPDGSFVRSWGTFTDTKGDPAAGERLPRVFYGPRGIAVGPDNSLYITDTGNKRVVIYDQSGKYLRQWGEGGSGESQLDEPIGIAVDTRGEVFVTDTRNSRVQVFDSAGRHLRSWEVSEWSGEGRLEPYVAVRPSGVVYVTDPIAKAVYRYSRTGRRLATEKGSGGTDLLVPLGIAVSPEGDVLVTDAASGNVLNLGEIR